MKNQKEHNQLIAVDRQSKAFFSNGTFQWKKSELAIWGHIESVISEQPAARSLTFNFKSTVLAIAASILLITGIGSFLRFYTTKITTTAGQHQLVELPDGSTVNLNAESTIQYYPYWWRFNRHVKFEGEGLFNVQKGKKFTVSSPLGTTEVLGTSFNIFSREEIYKVTCLTGSVRVTSKTKNQVILKPNSKAEVQANGKIHVQHNIDTYPEISWKKNIFLFTATPVMEVFYEIERQYGVTIKTKFNSSALYTGNFTKQQDVEEILGYVCPALGLKYMKKSATEYFVTQQNE